MKVKLLSRVRLFAITWTVAHQAALSMGTSRQEYWSGLFDEGHSDLCEVISHCSFDLHFSNNEQCLASFHVFVSHLYVFFGEMSV